MRGLPSILFLFRNELYKSTNVRLYLSDDIKNTLKSHFCRKKTLYFCHYVRNVIMDVKTFPVNL